MVAESNALRLDKWLWQARFLKSRSMAAALCEGGGITVNGAPVDKASRLVRPGDVVAFPAGPWLRSVRVLALGERRGPAPEARALYEELSLVRLDAEGAFHRRPVG
ncbi:MAG: RNA-binding S4 domain-containing protein [Alphaproteobacteria bacterium]|nr:RNA-binding S4 domain-containing protein [Alphaproteobacteria bacterium]